MRHTLSAKVDGVRILVSHYPRDVEVRGMAAARTIGENQPIPNLCIHGHTHCPKIWSGNMAAPADIVLCPGSASRPRDGYPASVAHVVVDDGRILSVSIESLTGEPVLSWQVTYRNRLQLQQAL